jgi:hypothetical protein
MASLLPIPRRLQYLVQSRAKALLVTSVSILGFFGLATLSRAFTGIEASAAGLRILAVAYPIVLTVGLVSGELSNGIVQLWTQKPVDPVFYYLKRLVEAVLVCGIMVALLTLVTRLGAGAAGWEDADKLLTVLPRLLLETTLVACVAFGVSAWSTKGGSILVLVVVFSGVLIDKELGVRTDVLGPIWNPLLRALSNPETALTAVTEFAVGQSERIVWPLSRIVLYASAWVGLGALGVARAVDNGGIARAQADQE